MRKRKSFSNFSPYFGQLTQPNDEISQWFTTTSAQITSMESTVVAKHFWNRITRDLVQQTNKSLFLSLSFQLDIKRARVNQYKNWVYFIKNISTRKRIEQLNLYRKKLTILRNSQKEQAKEKWNHYIKKMKEKNYMNVATQFYQHESLRNPKLRLIRYFKWKEFVQKYHKYSYTKNLRQILIEYNRNKTKEKEKYLNDWRYMLYKLELLQIKDEEFYFHQSYNKWKLFGNSILFQYRIQRIKDTYFEWEEKVFRDEEDAKNAWKRLIFKNKIYQLEKYYDIWVDQPFLSAEDARKMWIYFNSRLTLSSIRRFNNVWKSRKIISFDDAKNKWKELSKSLMLNHIQAEATNWLAHKSGIHIPTKKGKIAKKLKPSSPEIINSPKTQQTVDYLLYGILNESINQILCNTPRNKQTMNSSRYTYNSQRNNKLICVPSLEPKINYNKHYFELKKKGKSYTKPNKIVKKDETNQVKTRTQEIQSTIPIKRIIPCKTDPVNRPRNEQKPKPAEKEKQYLTRNLSESSSYNEEIEDLFRQSTSSHAIISDHDYSDSDLISYLFEESS